MILVDSEIVAGTCSGTSFVPIAGGRGYNYTTAVSHNSSAAVTEQLFVWANTPVGLSMQGVTTVAASAGYLSMNSPAGGAYLPFLVRPIPNGPASPYTVSSGFRLNGLASADQGCGMGFRQSSNNNESFVLYHAFANSNQFNVGEYQQTNGNYSGTYFNLNPSAIASGGAMFFQLQDTGSSRNVSVSSDGLNFILVHTVPTGDFLSPDQVFLSCTAGPIPSNVSYFSWTEGN
jgi:hypothetical protein